MSNSERKMEVNIKPMPWGKDWVEVRLLHSRVFIPSFKDLWRIVRAIGECEEKKYPNGKGRRMVADFLWAAVLNDDYEALAKRFKIPIRDEQGKIINANGSKYEFFSDEKVITEWLDDSEETNNLLRTEFAT